MDRRASRTKAPADPFLGDPDQVQEAKTGFWNAYLKFRQEFDPAEGGLDVEAVFGDRDSSPGRAFEW